jgi:hypothetical protein
MSKLPSKATDVYLDKCSIIPTQEKNILLYKSDEHVALRSLQSIDKISTEIVKSDDELFHSTNGNRVECGGLGKAFLNVIKEPVLERIESIFPESRFHPLISATMDAVAAKEAWQYTREVNLYEITGKASFIVELLNNVVADIRRKARSGEFKELLKNYERRATENRQGAFKLIEKMLRRYSKVLVVRVDFSYNKSISRPLEMQNLSHIDVRRDFGKLLRDVRSKLFKENYITYIWKLEYGPLRGYHYHAFFFFNGSEVMGDSTIAKMIGDHWSKVVTKGSGGYFNCNAIKEKYPTLGIGAIAHHDTEKINILKNVALEYLMKLDFYIRPIADTKIRTFQTGALPKVVSKHSGRPRRASDVKAVSVRP